MLPGVPPNTSERGSIVNLLVEVFEGTLGDTWWWQWYMCVLLHMVWLNHTPLFIMGSVVWIELQMLLLFIGNCKWVNLDATLVDIGVGEYKLWGQTRSIGHMPFWACLISLPLCVLCSQSYPFQIFWYICRHVLDGI